MATLATGIMRQLQSRGNAPALLWNDSTVSFADLDARSRRVATALNEHGVAPGDRVGVALPNSPELVAAALGTLRSGAVLVPINAAAPANEIDYVARDCGMRLLIAGEGAASPNAPHTERVLVDQLNTPATAADPTHDARLDDAALIIYTSGTTGRPKGAILSQSALYTNLSAVAATWQWSAADRLLLTLPCFHLHGLGLGIFTSLLVGSSIVLRPRFRVGEILGLLARHRCTMFFGVPTMYNRLVQLPADEVRGVDLSGMRLWVSGSAPLTPATHERFRQRFGFALMDRYGMTEAGFILSTRCDEARPPGGVGRPLPGVDLRLVDAEAADAGHLVDVADETTGELVFRGANLFSGYWGRPEQSARPWLSGYFRSGDLAVRHTAGRYRIAGRRSVDIIKSGGFKIGAVEIEQCLQENAAVAEVAVVGVPDADRGEVVVAAITPLPAAAVTEAELRSFVRERLAPHKVPARVVFLDEIPRTGPGKFKKRELVRVLQRRLADG